MPKRKAATRRSTPKAVENGQPTEEYRRFESLMKRLVRTPKPAPEKFERKRPA